MREKKEEKIKNKEHGNFMLQALLALSLVIAFMPFLAKQMSRQNRSAEMNATAVQIRAVIPAAKQFARDNFDNIKYGVTVWEKERFSDALESYGLPIGFIPRTPFSQKISLVTAKSQDDVLVLVRVSDGKMKPIDRAELAMRLGFWAAEPDDKSLRGATGGWEINTTTFSYKPTPGAVYVRVPLTGEFSDLLARKAKGTEDSRMHTDLLMGGRDIKNVKDMSARQGDFKSVLAADLVLSGIEDGRKFKNKFGELKIRRANFQAKGGESALSITRGVLSANSVSAPSMAKYGDPGNLNAAVVSAYDFTMSAGRTGFTGPTKWEVRENAILENVTINTEQFTITGYINAARGQDVFIDEYDLTYSAKSGIETNVISATNLTLRDQTSTGLLNGEVGPVIIDIRPAGVSVLPDAIVDGIDNNMLEIPASAADDSGAMTSCRTIIGSLGSAGASYNQGSLAQNIVCRYVFWQRLEQRIEIKKCMLEGRGKC